jgi:hypothetical protein
MTFREYMQQEDPIRRYVEYKAHQLGVTYEESARRSLARVYNTVTSGGQPMALLTAFRGEKPLPLNRLANKELESEMRSLGWGFIPVMGGFVEKVRDAQGKETGERKKIDGEESYLAVASRPEGFRDTVLNLLHKYAQEAAVVKYPTSPDAFLLDDKGSETSLGKWSNNKMADYYTRMRKGPAGRQFNFEAAGDASRTTMLAVDKFFEGRK